MNSLFFFTPPWKYRVSHETWQLVILPYIDICIIYWYWRLFAVYFVKKNLYYTSNIFYFEISSFYRLFGREGEVTSVGWGGGRVGCMILHNNLEKRTWKQQHKTGGSRGRRHPILKKEGVKSIFWTPLFWRLTQRFTLI